MVSPTFLSIKYLCQSRLSEIFRECTRTRVVWKKTRLPEMVDNVLKSIQVFEQKILRSIDVLPKYRKLIENYNGTNFCTKNLIQTFVYF